MQERVQGIYPKKSNPSNKLLITLRDICYSNKKLKCCLAMELWASLQYEILTCVLDQQLFEPWVMFSTDASAMWIMWCFAAFLHPQKSYRFRNVTSDVAYYTLCQKNYQQAKLSGTKANTQGAANQWLQQKKHTFSLTWRKQKGRHKSPCTLFMQRAADNSKGRLLSIFLH